MTQSYRNLIASGIVLQLAMPDVNFTLKSGASALTTLVAVRIYERRDF